MNRITNFFKGCFLFTYCLPAAYCFSQPVSSPDMKCLSVAANGDVTLTWTIPPPGSFVSYHIDTSSFAAGPFVNLTTVTPYSSTSYVHAGAGANTLRKYYLIYTESTGPVFSAPKDTFSTIFLSVSAGIGIANLSWNTISLLPISTSSGWYKIYREYPAGIWTMRDSTQNLFYTDVMDICNDANDVINYRIEIADNTGCTSVSNVKGAIVTDQTYPAIAPIDTVSVNAANLATISWNPSPSADADSVVIYKSFLSWIEIGRAAVPATSYTYTLSNAGAVSELFRIAFIDSCGNISPQGIEHKTIHLSAAFDICATTATLLWNQYINWIPTANQYQVLKSVNGGGYSLLATNPGGDTTYTDTGLALGNSYCYIIRATNGTKTSSSNKACFTANVSQPPVYNYNRYVTVVSDKTINLKAHVDPAQGAKYFRIQRAINGSGNFSVIVPAMLPVGTSISYTDNSVNAGADSYIYKVEAMDSCSNVIITSNPGTSILLKASIASNLDITLTWNDYGDWPNSVDHYEIYRAVDGVWGAAPFDNNIPYTGSGGTYTDDVAPFMNSKGIFSYYVVAIEESGNPYGFKDSSASNIAKVYEYPKIYVPNCFTPNGDNMNDIFIPVIGFIDPAEYSFRIFDYTGTLIMSTTNPAEGWNGKKTRQHGKKAGTEVHACQEGVYMYLINCKASNGDDSQLTGTVSLIR